MTFATSRAPMAGHRKGPTSSQGYLTTSSPSLQAIRKTHSRKLSAESLPRRPGKRQKVEVIVISDEEEGQGQDEDTPKKEPEKKPGNSSHGTSQEGQKQEAAVRRKEHYKGFIRENVVPHISSAVTKLPPNRYHVNMIAQKVKFTHAPSYVLESKPKSLPSLDKLYHCKDPSFLFALLRNKRPLFRG